MNVVNVFKAALLALFKMKYFLKLENMSACTETLAGAVSMPGLPAVAAAINTLQRNCPGQKYPHKSEKSEIRKIDRHVELD